MSKGGMCVAGLCGALMLAGCGGTPQLSQEESYDIVECSLVGWGVSNMPRKLCEQQGGLSLTARPYTGPGPYNAPTIDESRQRERQPKP